eukprot:CAMPEP_0176449976 /NCGR_PEP_ID=MMETSP0127-20121128/26840_1 /TAXON_ID=938130 /ORGANISM="Platyophrya macrostoma, Strain WH" /LENGTH=62 /DNA_ID=CAMNT_0017837501 /DNA_START=33 /DNA_END=218 /DNA_ORIENTATION=-
MSTFYEEASSNQLLKKGYNMHSPMIDNFSASFEATTNKFEKDYSFLEGHLNTPPYNAQSPQI